jgi:hypothetical protein
MNSDSEKSSHPLRSHKLSVKFYLDTGCQVAAEEVVTVFHSWIQSHAIPEHLLVDVADYSHVADGPGTVLVSHQANIYLDRVDRRLGLRYSRKQPLDGDLHNRLGYVFGAALHACSLLEEAPGFHNRLRFRTDRATFQINDRLLAPNTPDSVSAVTTVLSKYLDAIYGSATRIIPNSESKQVLTLFIESDRAPDLVTLRDRVAWPPAPATAAVAPPAPAAVSTPSPDRQETSLPRFDPGL